MPVYNVQLMDASNAIVSPSTVNILGNDDNTGTTGVPRLASDAYFTPCRRHHVPNTILNNSGVHTDALFFNRLPLGTQEIIVTATLPALNNLGDGVGYYFAEPVPEPAAFVLGGLGAMGIWIAKRRRKQRLVIA